MGCAFDVAIFRCMARHKWYQMKSSIIVQLGRRLPPCFNLWTLVLV